ncbi:ATP-binding protein [Microbispora triticiradicis]|uniref:ATP-binding protein n=1 Tax=Microbispora triticiradicis TaxID=2200763 RepID=UPI001AD750B9|nr:ATP-binding protein [Microbispora triticiradicis]MBO4269172.1 ATP-binding protein [Microbispora triticiradicis]
MSPTTAELVRECVLGELVDRVDFDLSGMTAPQSVARQLVRRALTCRTSMDQIDDAVLVADELVGNALQHGYGVVSMTLDIYEQGVTVSVLDRGTDISAIPTAPTVDQVGNVENEGGRGLFLVAQFATAWMVQAVEGGKAVVAVFDLTGGTQ